MNVIGTLRKQLSTPFDNRGASNAEESQEIKVIENQRFNPATERWSFKNLTQQDPKRFCSEIGETDQFPTIPLPAGWEYSGSWKIDYSYPQEMGASSNAPEVISDNNNKTINPTESSDTSTHGRPEALESERDLDEEQRPNEWVYSTSFEDLQQGILLDCKGLDSGSNTPMTPSSPGHSPVPEEGVSASLLAALEAEYSLKSTPVTHNTLVRQRRYSRTIYRKGSTLTAKGTALMNNTVNTTTKVLSTTNKFISDLGDAHKKDFAKLINVTKMAAAKVTAPGGANTSTSEASAAEVGESNVVEEGEPGINRVGGVEGTATTFSATNSAGSSTNPTATLTTPGGASSSTGSASGSRGTVGATTSPRVTSFTSRMFGSFTGASAGGPTSTPVAALKSDISTATTSTAGGSGVSDSNNTQTEAAIQSIEHNDDRNTTTTPTKGLHSDSRENNPDEPPLRRRDTNTSSLSGSDLGSERFAITDQNFEVEVDLDAADFNETASEMGDVFNDNASVSSNGREGVGFLSDSPNPGVPTVGGAMANPTAAKRRSTGYFGGMFTTTNSATTTSSTTPPPPPVPVVPIDPIFKIVSPQLVNIGKQLKNVEQQSLRAQEAEMKSWNTNVKPILLTEIAALEKQCINLMSQIEREVHMGNAHINSLEGILKEINNELDIKKRKVYLPDSAITLGSQGVYFGLNDFWLQLLSGHYSIKLLPKKDSHSEIDIILSGTQHHQHTTTSSINGVTIEFRIENFKLVGDKGKKIPKLQFENLKLAVSLQLHMTLSFDINTKKWLLPSKGFHLKILSFKGPYGINRSLVGMILSLVTPMIRTAIVSAIPHEVGMLLHSLPADFCLRGEFDIRGMDMGVLSTEFHRSEIFAQLSGYSATQLEMFMLMQRAMERSTIIKNLSDLILYRRKYSSQKDLWSQLLLIWSESCRTYSDAVITAKMEQLMEQSCGSINPLLMSIRFEQFLNACDDILHKRTTVKCKLHHIDGQISLNELIQFIFQVQHRLTSDEILKSNGIKKIRLENFVESLQSQFALARTLVSLICQNFDFAHLTIVGDIRSGPMGECLIKITDLLAQAPVLLNLSIMEEKNIGALSLVPYILSFKPQDNGDVCLELYSFNHDVALPVAPSTASTTTRDSLFPPTPSHFRHESTERISKELLALQLQYQQSLDNSSAGQCYSTNYNKLLQSITVNRAAGHSRNNPISALYPYGAGYDHLCTGTQSGANSPLRPGLAENTINRHLAVKHNVLQQALHATLNDYPTGEESDTICQILATNAHISVIVDQAVKLAAGTELFTVIVGPKVKTWQPLGRATLVDTDSSGPHPDDSTSHSPNPSLSGSNIRRKSSNLRPDDTTSHSPNPSLSGSNIRRKSSSATIQSNSAASVTAPTGPMGCPIKVQTAPGIKMLTQVEKADVSLNIPGLVRFLLAHFRDVPLLKEYLEIFVGGVFLVEHLSVIKLLIEKLSKYLLLPGLDLEINMNIRIVVNGEEIVVRVETPDAVLSNQSGLSAANLAARAHGSSTAGEGKHKHTKKKAASAVNLTAELSIKDILDDLSEVMEQMKVFLDPAPTATAAGSTDS